MKSVQSNNKMGTMPIPQLLISMSLPMIISMLVQAFYNVIDSIFVARISEDALTAVSLTFPVQNLMISVAAGTGVGINALLSRYLGEQKQNDANRVAKNGIFLSILNFILFLIIGLFVSQSFFAAQTNNADIIQYGSQYMSIICIFSFGLFMQMTFERLMQSTGRTIYNMITQGTGAIINIILDPILIFGLLGFPKMGVTGAALATVIGQIVAFLLSWYFNIKVNKEININMLNFRPNKAMIKNIYQIGFPAIIMQSIGSIMTFGMNKILLMFSTTATAVFGIYFKLQSFIFMPVFGLTNGIIPIVAFNYGAKNKKRIMDTYKLGATIAVSIMLLGLAAFQISSETFLKMFDASLEMIAIGVPALKIISLSFVFAGFCIVTSAIFQALGNGMYSLIVSVGRQLLVILPVAFIFAKTLGLAYVWWAIPIAEILSLILSITLMKKIYRDRLNFN